MAIRGAEQLTDQQFADEIARGARVVIFEYTISILVMTFKRGSDPFFVRPGEGTFGKSWPYSLLSFLFGWWGIPWGFIWTPMALYTNFSGGRDVTQQLLH